MERLQQRRLPAGVSRAIAGFTLLFAAGSAQASDFSGIVSMMFGIPALLLLKVILAMMLIAEPSRTLRVWAGTLGFPVLGAWPPASQKYLQRCERVFGWLHERGRGAPERRIVFVALELLFGARMQWRE